MNLTTSFVTTKLRTPYFKNVDLCASNTDSTGELGTEGWEKKTARFKNLQDPVVVCNAVTSIKIRESSAKMKANLTDDRTERVTNLSETLELNP